MRWIGGRFLTVRTKKDGYGLLFVTTDDFYNTRYCRFMKLVC